jgi:molybdate transport repressor ModE-like protein
MFKVAIKPQWTIREGDREVLVPRLIGLLAAIAEHGNLSSACRSLEASYRYAWGLLRQGETHFGAALVTSGRGKEFKLTALGEKLVWADRRIAARLSPILASLASELEAEIEESRSAKPSVLHLHASHGFAVEALRDFMAREQVSIEFKYRASQEAVASLANGSCEVAGFPIPMGDFEERALEHYALWLRPGQIKVIHVATRRQGLMVAHGNPKKIYELQDLAQRDVRFINREKGSGTRLLIEMLLERARISPTRLNGFEDVEYTHAAVAAYIASGRADAGVGVETPARKFDLEFIPLETERYLLACRNESFELPQIQQLLRVLTSKAYKDAVNALPGYHATHSGTVMTVRQAFPSLYAPPPRTARPAAPKAL